MVVVEVATPPAVKAMWTKKSEQRQGVVQIFSVQYLVVGVSCDDAQLAVLMQVWMYFGLYHPHGMGRLTLVPPGTVVWRQACPGTPQALIPLLLVLALEISDQDTLLARCEFDAGAKVHDASWDFFARQMVKLWRPTLRPAPLQRPHSNMCLPEPPRWMQDKTI